MVTTAEVGMVTDICQTLAVREINLTACTSLMLIQIIWHNCRAEARLS